MSQLSSFPAADLDTIVSLPYRVGIHVSYAEDEDGDSDDENEMRAIHRAISSYTKRDKTEEPPTFVQEVSAEILRRKAEWAKWTEGVFNIEPDCEKAIRILKPVVSDADLKAYINMVLEIAGGVARAYGEFGMPEEKPKGIMGIVKKVLGGDNTADQPMNVSAAEDDSIARITKALRKYA
jgi:hypothetical protein